VTQASQADNYLRLRDTEIEKAFTQVAIDLKMFIVFDGLDRLENPIGFGIHSHDPFGPLPDIVIEDTGDRYPVLDRIALEAAKLSAIVRDRQDLRGIFPACIFLLPTSTVEGALAGIRFRGRTVLAEAPSHWEAYHKLIRKAVRELL
jgi:hypothetical protein